MNQRTGRVFTALISDTNTESKGMAEKHAKMRKAQRQGLYKTLPKAYVDKIIKGGE